MSQLGVKRRGACAVLIRRHEAGEGPCGLLWRPLYTLAGRAAAVVTVMLVAAAMDTADCSVAAGTIVHVRSCHAVLLFLVDVELHIAPLNGTRHMGADQRHLLPLPCLKPCAGSS